MNYLLSVVFYIIGPQTPCKSKPWCSHSSELEKRMIDKIIMVLKAVIVFLELIRMFF
ncbi:damage-inducible type I toxin DinQ [Lelliottia amnigena]|uniref:damage-inducible type I toxin DinQ n=1 Tax=Lelliottia amnigena TaxID=61646 RepID=UPI0034CEF3BB